MRRTTPRRASGTRRPPTEVTQRHADLGWLYEKVRGATTPKRESGTRRPPPGTLAMLDLGRLYENGLGVAQDYAKAREWYEKAADKGHEAGCGTSACFTKR